MKGEIEISPFGSLLVYKEHYTVEDVRSIIQERKLRGLRIFVQGEMNRLSNLDFLSEYSFLEALDITSTDDSDFKFLKNLKNLRDLTISVRGKNIIDLNNQINLEELTILWRKGKVLGLERCNKITKLCLIDFSEFDFSAIASLTNLEDLKVKTASVTNCNGLKNLTNLEYLLLGNCRKLSELNGLEDLRKLKHLTFISCPKVKNFSLIGYLSNLEFLEITNCKGIDTIKFIAKLNSLKRFSLLGNNDILDGDLKPAKKINEVLYRHRKHYNIKIENKEFDNIIKSNLKKLKDLLK